MPFSPSARTLAWAGFAALAIAMGIGRFAFTPMLPMLQQDMGMSLAQGGWLAGANYLGYLAGALSAAHLSWTAGTLLRAGLLLVALTTALMGWTTAWPAWIAWRALAGIASAWVLVAAASLCLARLAALGASRRAGLVFSGVGGGIALAGALCMALDLLGLGALQSWLVLAIVATVGLLATLPLWPAPAAATAAHPTDHRPHTHDVRHSRLVLAYGLFGFGYILPATFLPAQARALYGDPALFGLAWPLFGLAAAASTLACSALLQWLPRRLLWLLAQLVMAVGVMLPAIVPGLLSIVVAAVCVGGTFMVITMLGMQQAQASGGRRARALMAALTAAFATGQLAGPVFFSLLHDHLGWTLDAALYVASALLVAGCALLLKPFAEPAEAGASEMPAAPVQSAR